MNVIAGLQAAAFSWPYHTCSQISQIQLQLYLPYGAELSHDMSPVL